MEIKESETIENNQDLVKDMKRAVEYEGDGDTNCIWGLRNGLQRLKKRLWDLEIQERIS